MQAGRTVRLQVGGIQVVVTENRISPFAPELLMHVGIDPASMRGLALKGGIVARSAYGDRISGSISVESPGWAPCECRGLPYRHVRRPASPLDDDAAFERRGAPRPARAGKGGDGGRGVPCPRPRRRRARVSRRSFPEGKTLRGI